MSPQLRSFDHSVFPSDRVRAERNGTISVCVPARECAATIEPIARTLVELREAGVVDQVLVLDSASADGTGELAAAAGAEVQQQAELFPDLGPVLGKGDAMWRSVTVLHGDVVCFLDG